MSSAWRFALVSFVLLLPTSAVAQSGNDAQKQKVYRPGESTPSVVEDLRVLLKNTPEMKADIEKALKASSWKEKSVDEFVTFFDNWLVYNIVPADPSMYIAQFDDLVNSGGGEILFNNNIFSSWFITFLEARGDYLRTPASAATMSQWLATEQIDWDEFVIPEGGFKTFYEFFLRKVKPESRPLPEPDNPSILVSPSDGGACQVFANNLETSFKIKRDDLNIRQALNNSPYAEKFVGGPVLDILLWFTDYHHFHAPVSGKIVEISEYPGSYNYDFDSVSWYNDLAKHKRLCYVFETEEFGHIAMIPVGFWGVGSVISTVKEGQTVEKGDEIGHFGYGGSSILLVFEPGAIEYSHPFPIKRENRGDGGFPVKVRMQLGVSAKDK